MSRRYNYLLSPDTLLRKVEIVAQPLATQDLVNVEAGVTVGQWQEESPSKRDKSQDYHTSNPCWDHARTGESLASRNMPLGSSNLLLLATLTGRKFGLSCVIVKDEFNKSTCHQRRGQMSRQVMMEEQLTTHYVEREVVRSPGQEEEARRFVKTRTGSLKSLA